MLKIFISITFAYTAHAFTAYHYNILECLDISVYEKMFDTKIDAYLTNV